MAEDYTIQQGDCISSLAHERGFFWKTLWDHSSNADLKSKRTDPNVLMEGDIVHIPDFTLKQESRATERRHKFKRKGVPSKLNVRFEFDGQPRAKVPFTLDIDGTVSQGTTDGAGWVRASLQPNAQAAKITLKPKNSDPEEYVLKLGHLDPIDTISGQKARLKNLGFFTGEISPENSAEYVQALKAFQRANGMKETGVADASINDKLKQMHRS